MTMNSDKARPEAPKTEAYGSETAALKKELPEIASLEIAGTEIVGPKIASPEIASPEIAGAKTTGAKIADCKIASPETTGCKTESPEKIGLEKRGPEMGRRRLLVVITGPTGSGKSDLAVEIAERFGAPVVSADSRQIYRGMAIGTAQPGGDLLERSRHYFIASHDITDDYTAGKYEKEALELIGRLFEAHEVVIAAGGSGMYIDALCHGLDALPDSDPEMREKLSAQAREQGLAPLLEQLARLDPDYLEKVDRDNPNRVIRALEVCLLSGRPYSDQRTGRRVERDFDIIKIATQMPREELYRRIDTRVERMMDDGLEAEARALYPHRELNSLQTVGYRELFEYFDGRITREEAVELIKRNSRRYAKRQITWLRRDAEVVWFDPADVGGVMEFITETIKNQPIKRL